MNNQTLYIVGAVVLGAVIIAGAIMYSPNEGGRVATTTSGGSGAAPPTSEIIITADDHIRGNIDAPITIVEYSDFQCPFCQRFHPTVLRALAEYPDDVRWVYRHFPLRNIHAQAQPAAEASECVAEQKGDEGFWAFGDAMFANQGRLGTEFYREVAGELGVNLAQFDSCVSSNKYKDKVDADYNLGIQLGITGTPGSFVNGVPVRGAIPYEQLQSIIESQL